MKKYRFVRTELFNPYVWTTHPEIIDWLHNAIKKQIPTCDITDTQSDLTGEIIVCQFHKLKGKDREVAHAINKLLCDNGFQPFDMKGLVVHYRQEIEE
jgi:hypothetical protein